MVERCLNEMADNNNEAVAVFNNGQPNEYVITLDGFSETIAAQLKDTFQWDAGVEGYASVEMNYPINKMTIANASINAYVDIDEWKKNHKVIVNQEDGGIYDKGEYIDGTTVRVNTYAIAKMLEELPLEMLKKKEYTESIARRITESVIRTIKEQKITCVEDYIVDMIAQNTDGDTGEWTLTVLYSTDKDPQIVGECSFSLGRNKGKPIISDLDVHCHSEGKGRISIDMDKIYNGLEKEGIDFQK